MTNLNLSDVRIFVCLTPIRMQFSFDTLMGLRELLLRLHADDSRLDEMLPDRWAANHPESILTYRLEESRQKAARQRERRQRRRALRWPT